MTSRQRRYFAARAAMAADPIIGGFSGLDSWYMLTVITLASADEPIIVSELGDSLGVGRSTFSRGIDTLIASGLVRKKRQGRFVYLTATKTGQTAAQRHAEILEGKS